MQFRSLAKSTNKNLLKIIKKIVDENQKNWHKELNINVVWADRIPHKTPIGASPYFLVYGKEVILPPNIVLSSISLVQSIQEDSCSSLQHRQAQIFKLEEARNIANKILINRQKLVKQWFDNHTTSDKNFNVGDKS